MITLANLSKLGNIDCCGRIPFAAASVELECSWPWKASARRESRAAERGRGCTCGSGEGLQQVQQGRGQFWDTLPQRAGHTQPPSTPWPWWPSSSGHRQVLSSHERFREGHGTLGNENPSAQWLQRAACASPLLQLQPGGRAQGMSGISGTLHLFAFRLL